MYPQQILPLMLVVAINAQTLLVPNVFDQQGVDENTLNFPLAASKIGEGANLTTYSVDCKAASTTCAPPYFSGYTYKLNPSIFEFTKTNHEPDQVGGKFTMSRDCSLLTPSSGTVTSAICKELMKHDGRTTTFTDTYEYHGYLTYLLAAEVPKTTSIAITESIGTQSSTSVPVENSSTTITKAPVSGTQGAGSRATGVVVQTKSTSTSGALRDRFATLDWVSATVVLAYLLVLS